MARARGRRTSGASWGSGAGGVSSGGPAGASCGHSGAHAGRGAGILLGRKDVLFFDMIFFYEIKKSRTLNWEVGRFCGYKIISFARKFDISATLTAMRI